MSRAVAAAGSLTKVKTSAIKFRYLLLLTILFAGSFVIFSSINTNVIFIEKEPSRAPWDSKRYQNTGAEVYTINTQGCRIPAMEPFSDTVKKFVSYPTDKLPCTNSSLSLLAHDREEIWVVKDVLPHYKATENNIKCCYQSFFRPAKVADITSRSVDNRVEYSDCIYFNDKIKVSDEFVKVTCRVKNKKVYEQYYPFTPKKEFSINDDLKEIAKNISAYNVLILGIDSVSRLNFYRTMPKTLEYLKNKGAVEMLGYNKVADNTFPNVVPMLMGISESQLSKICLPRKHSNFDNCPFIWEFYKQAGFYTALAEDCSDLGTFTYQRTGFLRSPTDYYFHTFVHSAEHNVGTNKDFNTFLCMNDKHFYKVLLDYVENLTETLKDSKMFGFFWEVSMSHDYLNYPMVMDADYLNLFEKFETSGYLNDTIVFLLSDHGMRWGSIRSTQQGRLEERLPFAYVLTPPSFKENYKNAYDNLHINSNKLITPFDIYATLNDLIDLSNVDNLAIENRSKGHYANDRSISLFLPIPTNRTCAMAGIDDHWCTCHGQVSLNTDDSDAVDAASNLITILNILLKQYPQCAELTMVSIERAVEVVSQKSLRGQAPDREFLIVVKTTPGDGLFEATLTKNDSEWSLSGTVSRLNLYGEQSRCVHDNLLKLYCYCI